MTENNSTMKRCADCQQEFPATVEYFSPRGNKLYSYCHHCSNRRSRTQRQNQKPRPGNPRATDPVEYQCLDCGGTFTTQHRRIKPGGNRCQRCWARFNNSQRTYASPTKEALKKMALAKKGKPGHWMGKRFSEEHRQRLSEARKGKPAANKGKPRIDPEIRKLREQIHDCCSGMVRRVLKIKDEKKVRTTFQYLGYTQTEFKCHLETRFTEGMSWNNYGEWQVDHIIPVAEFVRQGITDVRTINALENLQPLWKIDNLKKGDRVIH